MFFLSERRVPYHLFNRYYHKLQIQIFNRHMMMAIKLRVGWSGMEEADVVEQFEATTPPPVPSRGGQMAYRRVSTGNLNLLPYLRVLLSRVLVLQLRCLNVDLPCKLLIRLEE